MANKKDFSLVKAMLDTTPKEEEKETLTKPQKEDKLKKLDATGKEKKHLEENYKYNLTKEDLDLLKAVAMVKGITIKDLIKEALDSYLKQNKEATDKAKAFLESIKK